VSILVKHIWRNIRENKFRSMVIVLVVLLSTAVSFVVFNLQDIIIYNYDKVYNASVGQANITIQQNDAMAYSLQDLNLDGTIIEKQSNIYQFAGRYETGLSVIKVNLIGVNINEYQNMDAVSLLNVQEGFSLHPSECVISLKAAEQYGLSVGNLISVNIQEQELVFQIAAIAEPNRTFYEEKGNFQILISLEDANTINGTAQMATKTRLKVSDLDLGATVEQLQTQNVGFTVFEGEEFEKLHYNLSTIASVLLIIVIIVILIGVYILYSLVKLIMVDRLPIIGTFRSVGASRGKVINILLLEFLSYGFIGTVLGLLAAVPLLPFIADLFNQYKELGIATEVTYSFGYGVSATCIGLLLPVFSALAYVIQTSKTPLKDIILKPSSKLTETSVKSYMVAALLVIASLALYFFNVGDNMIIGFIGLFCLICSAAVLVPVSMTVIARLVKLFVKTGSVAIGLHNLQSNKTVRNIGSMFTVVILIVVMMTTLTNGIKNVAATDIANSSAYDVIVTLNGEDVRASDLLEFKNVDGALDSYESLWFGDYCIGSSRVYGIGQFNALNEYVRALIYDGDNLDELLQNTAHGIIVDEYWARVQNLSVGDIVTFYTDEKQTSKIGNFTVAGFWDSSTGTTDRGFVGISLDDFQSLITDVPDKILVRTSTPESVAQAISERYLDTDIAAVTTEKYMDEQIAAVNTMIGMLFACAVLGAIIIVCGIISNLIVSFIGRKKEYAVMYSVCMSKRQLMNMLFWEFLFSCISIGLVSIVAGFALSEWFLSKAANGTGMVIDFQFSITIMLAILAVVFGIYAVTTTFPIHKLKKLNVMEELRYE